VLHYVIKEAFFSWRRSTYSYFETFYLSKEIFELIKKNQKAFALISLQRRLVLVMAISFKS